MQLQDSTVLITGGAGLVGSHLADRLLDDGATVRVVDDLSKGRRDRIPDDATFIQTDLTDPAAVADVVTADLDIVFHLAAYTDTNYDDDRKLFEENTEMTYNLLEQMQAADIDKFAFTSSSTVYGEAPRPTPEDYAPLEPISIYGSSKLAAEALISTYAHSYDIQSWVFRFANIVGPYQRGNVVPDFIEKLDDDPNELTILGDGRQEKSYLHVSECVDAMQYVVENADDGLNIYNLGTKTTTSVTEIADIISDELGSIQKLAALGWEPAMSSHEAVRHGAQDLIAEIVE